jgi:hypothetical protein
MKALAVLLGVSVMAVAAFLLLPRPPAPKPKAQSAQAPESPASRVLDAPTPVKSLEPPLTAEEEVRREFARRRLPFYRYLREGYGDIVTHFAVTERIDTLDLVVARDDDATLKRLVAEAVAPSAELYGFRKVRFYRANPPRSVEPLTLVAESTYDEAGRWNTFRK